MTNWKNIWDRKGREGMDNPMCIDGWENSNIDMDYVYSQIKNKIKLKRTNKVLEVGCGAGALSKFFIDSCNYFGCDYSEEMIKKYKALNNNKCRICEANDLPFEDGSFDKAISFSVFHYFPDHEYANKCISELRRVTRTCVFIGDLPYASHDDSHLLFDKNRFKNWDITDSFVRGRPRFNIFQGH